MESLSILKVTFRLQPTHRAWGRSHKRGPWLVLSRRQRPAGGGGQAREQDQSKGEGVGLPTNRGQSHGL